MSAPQNPLTKITADNHVHTEWSFDAPNGSLSATCAEALRRGLSRIACTEHAEFTPDPARKDGNLRIQGFMAAVAANRDRFPDLHIVAGVELGQPHRFSESATAVLGTANFELVLGSVHCVFTTDGFVDLSDPDVIKVDNVGDLMTRYLEEVKMLVSTFEPFEVLAHLDFPKRYWPVGALPYRAATYEAEYRDILSGAAGRGLVLEINTTRGRSATIGLSPDPAVIGWWRQQGGALVSFGSDAHDPSTVGNAFETARQVAEACGFGPVGHPDDFWGIRRLL